jgi:hypothetical protein
LVVQVRRAQCLLLSLEGVARFQFLDFEQEVLLDLRLLALSSSELTAEILDLGIRGL